MRELNVELGENLNKVFPTTEVTINYNGARIYPSGSFKLTDVNNVIQKNLQENLHKIPYSNQPVNRSTTLSFFFLEFSRLNTSN